MSKKKVVEEYISGKPMTKKKWTDKRDGLKKLVEVAKFNKQKATDDIEELEFMISALKSKI